LSYRPERFNAATLTPTVHPHNHDDRRRRTTDEPPPEGAGPRDGPTVP